MDRHAGAAREFGKGVVILVKTTVRDFKTREAEREAALAT